jgi:hypothetical protein
MSVQKNTAECAGEAELVSSSTDELALWHLVKCDERRYYGEGRKNRSGNRLSDCISKFTKATMVTRRSETACLPCSNLYTAIAPITKAR